MATTSGSATIGGSTKSVVIIWDADDVKSPNHFKDLINSGAIMEKGIEDYYYEKEINQIQQSNLFNNIGRNLSNAGINGDIVIHCACNQKPYKLIKDIFDNNDVHEEEMPDQMQHEYVVHGLPENIRRINFYERTDQDEANVALIVQMGFDFNYMGSIKEEKIYIVISKNGIFYHIIEKAKEMGHEVYVCVDGETCLDPELKHNHLIDWYDLIGDNGNLSIPPIN